MELGVIAARIRADRDMLRQILHNLLVNAARALGPGGRIRLETRTCADRTCILELHDDGEGIPPEDMEKIFEPYYTRTPGGTGLGLAIVRRLVEAHGWRIEIDSQPGAGTLVRIVGVEVIDEES